MDTYCIYLRKSSADAEAEARGEGETLARHEHTLCDVAKRQKLHISKIYREIVSGETIAARPQMQQLLQDVESGIYAGVLVMEVERLARGDTIDQGIVAQAFKYSGTKIVTPTKTYDPDNEFDEEYFEFSLFMSRREYKTIKRRMQAWAEAKAPADEIVNGWNLTKLEEAGANRWTKYGKDRVYLSRIGDALMGLELDFYKSGNICGAWLNNEKISNRESFRVGEAYSRAYIDLASGKVYECVGRYADDFMDKLNATFHA